MSVFRIYFGNRVVGSNDLAPSLVVDGDTFHQPTVASSVTVEPSLVVDTDTFHAPTVSASATLTPSLFSDTDVFFEPTVAGGAVTLSPSLYDDTDVFHAPTVEGGAVTLTPSLFSDDDTFFQSTVSADATLLPGHQSADDVFYVTTVSTGTITLTPSHQSADDTFYVTTVSAGEIELAPSLFSDTDVFFQPQVSIAQTLTASLHDDTDVFFQPTVSVGGVTLSPSLFVDTDVFFQPTVVPGAVTLLPSSVVDADTIHAPSVISAFLVLPPFVPSDDVIYTPIDAAFYEIFPSFLDDDAVVYLPSITVTNVGVQPGLFVDADVFYVPTVQRQNSQGGGGGGNNIIPANVKYATPFTMATSGLISALQIQSNNAEAGAHTRMMLYADSAGVPGALLAQSNIRTGLSIGTTTYALITPHSVLAGEKVWVTIHTDANIRVLGNAASGSRYNTDLFSDGPSDPFGASSADNKKAPVLLVILESANATMAPPLVVDSDVFHAPSLGALNVLPPALVDDTDFFYAAVSVGTVILEPSLYDDTDAFYSPTTTVGEVSVLPSHVDVDDEFLDPQVAAFSPTLFPPHVVDADDIGLNVITAMGAELPPGIVEDEDLIYVPDVLGVVTLAPDPVDIEVDPIVGETDVFLPVVTVGSVALAPGHVTDVDQFWFAAAAQSGGDVTLRPNPVGDDDAIYPPVRVGAARRAHHVRLEGAGAANPVVGAGTGSGALISGLSGPQATLRGATPGTITIEGDASGAAKQLEGNDA